jgi:hypothetical protein
MQKHKYHVVRKGSCHALHSYVQLGAANRMCKRSGADDFEVIDTEEKNRRGSEEVVVQNLMSGKDITITRAVQGTCCDPSTERYWSM